MGWLQRLCQTAAISCLCGVLAACNTLTMVSGPMVSVDGVIEGPTYSLPKGLITLSAVHADSKLTLQATPLIVPDVASSYQLRLNEDVFASDHYVITTDANGLLSSINSDNTDQTPAIVAKIIQIADAVIQAGALRAAAQAPPPIDFSISLAVDPFSPASVRRAKKVFSDHLIELKMSDLAGEPLLVSPASEIAEPTDCISSVCFRPVAPVRVSFTVANTAQQDVVLVLPDPRLLMSYNIRRGPCIQRVTNLKFTNGVMSSVDLSKPSEVLGCLDIPLQIAKAFTSIPSELLTLKINQTNQETSLLKAQTDLLKAQTALMATRLGQAASN